MAFTKIESGAIAQNAVSSDSIAPGAVTVADVEDGSLTAAKLDASVQSTLADVANKADTSSVPTDISQLADNTGLFDGKLDVTVNGIVIPSLASDPSSPIVGQMYYNTTDGVIKNYNGSKWSLMSNKFTASGGTETTYSDGNINYKVHTFTSSGTFNVDSAGSIDVLVVAGGGSGGGYVGGGGGAGGLIYQTNVSVNPTAYTINIGAGGAIGPNTTNSNHGNAGSNTTAFGLTAIGGGYGSNYDDTAGGSGGSGGGAGGHQSTGPFAGGSGTSGQGYAGGSSTGPRQDPYTAGGGGGGSAGVGGNATAGQVTAPSGGPGTQINIDGNNYYWAAGGGAGNYASNTSPANGGAGGIGGGGGGGCYSSSGVAGTGGGSALNAGGNGNYENANSGQNSYGGNGGANTGSGGGGAGHYGNDTAAGGGGSGIVIIRYAI